MSVLSAAQTGDRRLALEAMRDALSASMDAADVAVMAQLSGQLRMVLADLAALPAVKELSKTDELRSRRDARRRSTATVVSSSAGKGV